jgi:hypothetical protein
MKGCKGGNLFKKLDSLAKFLITYKARGRGREGLNCCYKPTQCQRKINFLHILLNLLFSNQARLFDVIAIMDKREMNLESNSLARLILASPAVLRS